MNKRAFTISFALSIASLLSFAQTRVPDRRDVSIYQVNIRAFSPEGNFMGIMPRLDSIKSLGVNVVYLMPVYPVGKLKSTNSPYCVSDYTAVNPEFGTLKDLQALIDGIHQRNMAVIFDWVPNHTSWDAKWIVNKSWYQQDASGNIITPVGMGWNDVAALNFKNAEMRLAMIKSMRYWIETVNIDGYRCDYADGQPIDFWQQAFDSLKKIPGHRLLMLAEGRHNDLYKVGFDYIYGFRFFEDLKPVFASNRSVRSIDTLNEIENQAAADGQQPIRYTTNHDVNSSDGTPQELFGGTRGSMAAFIVAAYMESIPMIYSGQEVGTPYRIVFPFTAKRVDWSLNKELTAEYKKILALRNSSEAIRRGQLTSYSSSDACVFIKAAGENKVLVLSNLRKREVKYNVPPALAGTNWKNAFTEKSIKLHAVENLKPYSYLVLQQ